MKSVLQINVTANIGSTGRIVENLGDLAIKNGWNSYIACRDFNDSNSNIIQIGNKKDKYIHFIQSRGKIALLLIFHYRSSMSSTLLLLLSKYM